MEHLHYLVAIDDGLQEALVVLLLEVGNFFTHHSEILKEDLFSYLILRRDISLAEQHKVVDVITGIIDETTNCTVGDLLVGDGNGTHVELHHLLHKLHLHVEG